jgi:hypothetical protein
MAGNQERPTEDVEGHGLKGHQDAEAADDRGGRIPDDTEGHRHLQDAEAVDEDQVGDDTEGHSGRFGGNQRIEAGDDVEGHGGKRVGGG